MNKILFAFGILALGAVSARPRYLVIPIEDVQFIAPAQRRDDGIPAFSIPAEIRQAEDAITAGSNNYAHGSHGPDYVDYGAYTGGYGAFGWYSDHPVGGGYHH